MTVEPGQLAVRHSRAKFALPFAAIAAIFLALIAYQIYVARLAAHAAAVTNANNLTLILESKLNTDFSAAERTVSAMISEVEPDAMRPELASRFSPRIARWLKSSVEHISLASALVYFDANGDRLYSSMDGGPPINIADRPLFRQLRGVPAGATIFSEVTVSRTTGRVSIFVAQSVRDKQGVFLGAAVTVIDLNSVYQHFRSLELGKNGVVALRRLDDGASVVRFPGPIVVDNKPTPDLPVRKAILSNGPVGVMDITSRVDGSQRIYGYRRIGAFPLFIAVGIAESDFLAEWRRDSALLLAGASVFLAILAAVFFRLAVAESRRRESESQLRESELRFRNLTEMSSDFYWESDVEHRLTQRGSADGNSSNEPIFRQNTRMGQRRWEMPYLSPDEAGWQAHRAQLDAHLPFRNFEFSRLAADGEERHVSISGDPVFDAAGVFKGYCGVGADITERKRMEALVRQMAFHDTLTSLPNRRLLNDRLSQAMAANKRTGCHGALMFLDLDNFKLLNDTHGHEVGDLLLIEAARRLKSCVRDMDTVARFGGDEFVVMISELGVDKAESAAQAGIIAEKVRAAMAKPYVFNVEHEGKTKTTVEHHCTASIGVALFSKHDASQEDILKWADAAMYRAKEAGCNLIRFHDQSA